MGRIKSSFARFKKSVMSRLAPLSAAQRADMQALINQGIPADEARAIAQAGVVVTRKEAESEPQPAAKPALQPKATPSYHEAYVKAAKEILPEWQHDILHKQARASAGGKAAKRARLRGDDAKRQMLDEQDLLKARINYLQTEIAKTSVLASEVHVDVPLGRPRRPKQTIAKTSSDAAEMAYIKAAYDLQAPIEPPDPNVGKVPDAALRLLQANNLVKGMDMEMAKGAGSPEEARRRASRALMERPELYDSIGANSETARLRGLQLDIGSGSAREPGYLGLDLGTFGDYGNIIHDVNLGLDDFPDGCARGVRLVNALHPILDDEGEARDPTPLLLEIQRVLCLGGQLVYEGPELLFESDRAWPAPGLALMAEQGTRDGVVTQGIVRQRFERIVPLVPAYHAADPNYAAAQELPIDLAMALAAYNSAPAEIAMANLIHKRRGLPVKIAKTNAMKQIVYGVVLEPFTADYQDDSMSPADIEEAAHGYLGTSRIIGSEHGAPIEAHPVESYIAPQDLTFDGPGGRTVVTKGSWVLGVKVQDPAHWQKVMTQGYTGFSVGGYGLREPM